MLAAADGQACLSKSYSAGALLRSLEIVMDIAAARMPFPPGFRVLPLLPLLDLDPSFRL
jgi:hypothetical protein